jgi:hypothetical protein
MSKEKPEVRIQKLFLLAPDCCLLNSVIYSFCLMGRSFSSLKLIPESADGIADTGSER